MKRHNMNRKALLLLGDVFIVLAAVAISGMLRFGVWEISEHTMQGAPVLLGALVASMFVSDLYNLRALGSRFLRTEYLSRYALGIAMAVAVATLVFYAWPSQRMGRGILLDSSVPIAGLCFAWRMLYRRLFILYRRKTLVAVVGKKEEVEVVKRELGEDDFAIFSFERGWKLTHAEANGDGIANGNGTANGNGVANGKRAANGNGLANGHDRRRKGRHSNGHPQSGRHRRAPTGVKSQLTTTLPELLRNGELDAVVIGSVETDRALLVRSLVDAKMYGIEIHTPASLVERVRCKVPITGLTEEWMAFTPFQGFRRGVHSGHVKRMVDVALASAGLVMSSPVIALAAIAIKCESPGSIFYRQTRVGLDGKEFRIIKLRSMRNDAERGGAVWAKVHDSRVTRVGSFLRSFRIDELPQMWNVLRGDMTLIGPRPERPEFVKLLEEAIPFYAVRHAVRPGITGWAQVNFRYGATNDDAREKLEYDLFYIKNQSLFLDLVTVFKTVRVVMFGAGGQREVSLEAPTQRGANGADPENRHAAPTGEPRVPSVDEKLPTDERLSVDQELVTADR